MGRRRDSSSWPFDDEQCPERGPALSHIHDKTAQCVYCGAWTRERPAPVTIEDPETGDRLEFTDRQIREIEFLRYLYGKGRV